MTEPGIGSDLASMSTRAKRDGDHYVVNGSKTFITNGINADLVITAVKTDPSQRHRGISLLVIERGMEGFERGRNLEKIGQHAQDTAELSFADVRVPVENLLGEEGEGFRYLVSNLPAGASVDRRLGRRRGRGGVRSGRCDYVRERQAFGQSIGSFQSSRFTLAEARGEVEIARAFVDRCARALDAGELTAEDAATAKWWCTDLQGRVDRPLPAAVRRLRLHARVPDRPRLRRCPRDAHLRRRERDHEGDRRALAGSLTARRRAWCRLPGADSARRRDGADRSSSASCTK